LAILNCLPLLQTGFINSAENSDCEQYAADIFTNTTCDNKSLNSRNETLSTVLTLLLQLCSHFEAQVFIALSGIKKMLKEAFIFSLVSITLLPVLDISYSLLLVFVFWPGKSLCCFFRAFFVLQKKTKKPWEIFSFSNLSLKEYKKKFLFCHYR